MVVWTIKSKLKGYFQTIISMHFSPHELAIGAAIGSLIAILPTPGFSVLIAGLVILLYPKISKITLLVR